MGVEIAKVPMIPTTSSHSRHSPIAKARFLSATAYTFGGDPRKTSFGAGDSKGFWANVYCQNHDSTEPNLTYAWSGGM